MVKRRVEGYATAVDQPLGALTGARKVATTLMSTLGGKSRLTDRACAAVAPASKEVRDRVTITCLQQLVRVDTELCSTFELVSVAPWAVRVVQYTA